MKKKIIKSLSILLLISITFSFHALTGQGQQGSRTGASEITFMGKEETKWTEKRETPLPLIMAQGVKEEPQMEALDLREEAIGPMQKMSPSATVPGCGYSSGFTRTIAKALEGNL